MLAKTFLPSDAYLEILEMQAYFIEQMGIVLEDTYLDQYLKVFRRLPADGSLGPTAVMNITKLQTTKLQMSFNSVCITVNVDMHDIVGA